MQYVILLMAIFSSGCGTLFAVFPNWFEMIPYPEFTFCLPAVAWGVYCWLTRKSLANAWVTILFLGIATCSLGITNDSEVGRGIVILAYLVCAVVIGSTLQDLKTVNFVLISFLLASLLNLGLMIYLGGGTRLGTVVSNVSGRISNPNTFGSQMALAFNLVVSCYLMDKHLFLRDGNLKKYVPPFVFFVLAGTFFLATIASGSRGATLALMVTCCVFLLSKQITSLRIVVAMGCLLFGVTLFVVEDGPLADATERFRDIETLNTMGDRLPIWRAGLQVLHDNWTTGVGIGGVEKELGSYLIGIDSHVKANQEGIARRAPHNTYLEWSLTAGAGGMIIGGMLMYRMVRNGVLLDRKHNTVFRRSIIVYVGVSAMTLTIFRHHYWIALGAILIAFMDNTPVTTMSCKKINNNTIR